MEEQRGKYHWIFPDGELPPPGTSELKGHESIIILNMNTKSVSVRMKLYFTDKDPLILQPQTIDAERVRCIRMDNSEQIGYEVPRETQYAIAIEADAPVVVQYGRLDVRQSNLAFYTTMGYNA